MKRKKGIQGPSRQQRKRHTRPAQNKTGPYKGRKLLGREAIRSLKRSDIERMLEPAALKRSLQHLTGLFATRPELAQLRFDRVGLAESLRKYGDKRRRAASLEDQPNVQRDNPSTSDALHDEMMAEVLPPLVRAKLVEGANRALEQCLKHPQNTKEDVKALLTALFLVEAEKRNTLPTAGNPLWELILSLSIGELAQRQGDVEGLVEPLEPSEDVNSRG